MTKHMSLSEFELLAYPEITPQEAAAELMRRRQLPDPMQLIADCSPSRASLLSRRSRFFTAREWLEVAALATLAVFLFSLPAVAIFAAFLLAR